MKNCVLKCYIQNEKKSVSKPDFFFMSDIWNMSRVPTIQKKNPKYKKPGNLECFCSILWCQEKYNFLQNYYKSIKYEKKSFKSVMTS